MKTKDWFTDWFNTPYYHILYKDRNDNEAQQFIKKITEFLSLPKNATLLDLPCGKGRHSVFLNSLGFKVIGADLSENSRAMVRGGFIIMIIKYWPYCLIGWCFYSLYYFVKNGFWNYLFKK